MKCKAHLRYGDDFVIFSRDRDELLRIKSLTTDFIEKELKLNLHAKNNLVVETKHGLKFLGVIVYPNGRKLNKRNQSRIERESIFATLEVIGELSPNTEVLRRSKSFNWIY